MKAKKSIAGLLAAALVSGIAGSYGLPAYVPAKAVDLNDTAAVQQPADVTLDEEWLYTTTTTGMETTATEVTTSTGVTSSTALLSSEEQSETTTADIDWIKRLSDTRWNDSTGRYFDDTDENIYAKFELSNVIASDIARITGKITLDGGKLEELYGSHEIFTSVGYTMESYFDDEGAFCFTIDLDQTKSDEGDLILRIYMPCTETSTLRLTDSKCYGTGGQMRNMNDTEDTVRIRTTDSTEVYTTTTSEPHAYTTTVVETTSSESLTTPPADVHSTDTQSETTATESVPEETTEETTTTTTETTTEVITTTSEETTTISEETTTVPTETTTAPAEDKPDETLPQTGYPQWLSILIAGAAVMTTAGGLAVKKSGVWKKEEDEV